MSTKYKIRDQTKLYFITFSVIDWIDVFTRQVYRDVLLSSLNYCIEFKGLILYAYCIMSNHIHMIVSSREGFKQEDIIRDFKKYTAKEIIKLISQGSHESRKSWMLSYFKNAGLKNSNNKKYQFWQQQFHPIELFSNRMMDSKLEYIHNNPVKAGIVEKPEDYLYSSARDYCGRKGLIEITLIE